MNFKRYYIPDAIVFITQVVQDRKPVFAHTAHLKLLRKILNQVKILYPFKMWGYAFLPDHFHMLIQPQPPVTFSQIMHSLKTNFTREYKRTVKFDGSMTFWQKRFWEHTIRDEFDFQKHLDYLHFNPVKHGYVKRPDDWMQSSFVEWKSRGAYPERWGWQELQDFSSEYWSKIE